MYIYATLLKVSAMTTEADSKAVLKSMKIASEVNYRVIEFEKMPTDEI